MKSCPTRCAHGAQTLDRLAADDSDSQSVEHGGFLRGQLGKQLWEARGVAIIIVFGAHRYRQAVGCQEGKSTLGAGSSGAAVEHRVSGNAENLSDDRLE